MADNKIYKDNNQILTIQAETKSILNTKVEFFSFDSDTARFIFKLQKDQQPLPISTAAKIFVVLKFTVNGIEKKRILDSTVDEELTVQDSTEGTISLVIPSEYRGYVGMVTGGVYVQFDNGQSLDCGYFRFTMKKSMIDETLEDMSDFYVSTFESLHEQILTQSSETQELLDTITTEVAALEENYAPQLNTLTAQLADTASVRGTFHDTLTSIGYARLIAHRGLNYIAPENTLVACEWAGIHGFWGSEFDVQTTSDGKWVVMHDSTVDRTTNGTGAVSGMTFEQLRSLTIDTGNNISFYPNLKVPSLAENLAMCKKVGVVPVIEIKSSTYTSAQYESFIQELRDSGLESKCIVITTSQPIITEIRKRSKAIPIQLLSDITQQNIDFLKTIGNAGFDCQYINLSKENVSLAHANGFLVNCWTVNNQNHVNDLIELGVDFISSDKIMEVGL